MIGNVNGSTGWVSTDLTGTAAAPLNARLNPLGNYGGPTYTMTLAAYSPALGAGLPSLINWEGKDQRGYPRVVDGKVDIGAIETQTPLATLPIPVVIGPGSTNSPGPVLTTLTPTFTWKPITTGITGYQLNLYDNTAGKSYSYNIGATATSFNLPAGVLVAGDKYVWNLRVLNGTASGGPSTYLYFQAPPAETLPVPVVLEPGTADSPGPVLTTLTPTFRWDPITTGITGYQLNLYDVTSGKGTSYTFGISVSSFNLPAGVLVAGDSYVWNLRVLNGTASGGPSTYLYFQAPPATTLPVPIVLGPGTPNSPGPVLTTFSPTFSWEGINTGITGFQLNLYDSTASKSYSYTLGASATAFTAPAGVILPGDAYVWNLRVVNGAPSGKPSTYLYFQAPPASALPAPVVIGPGSITSPGPTVVSATPTFTWNAVKGYITGYQLNLYDITQAKFVSYQIDPTATSFTVPSALGAGDAFVWNLRVVDGTVTGPESDYLFFQTTPPV